MEKIYSAKTLKEAESSLCGITLMERAALCIIDELKPYLNGNKLTVICGSGNNGGDGWAVASILNDYPLCVIYTDEPKTDESIYYRKKYKGLSFPASSNEAFSEISNSKLILDCIFGIGINRPAEGIYKKLFDLVNESDAFVVSADVPSGIPSDCSKVFPHINADLTVCITSRKLSGVVTPTSEYFGKTVVCDIGVDMNNFSPIAEISDVEILKYLPKRKSDSHKGTFGTLKTLCGSFDMPGAGILAITSALRSGVGLIKVFGKENLLGIYKNRLTEPVFKEFSADGFVEEKASAVLIGCGICKEFENELSDIFSNLTCPIIADADGINFLSRNIDIFERISSPLILTPHPAEMARLCGISVKDVQENRFHICKETSEKLNCTVVLKGSKTIVCTPGFTPIINSTGNSGLAKGGSGDVLAGIIASFVSQGVHPHYAAALGVYLHGKAADSLKERLSEFSFLPSDIPFEVGKIIADTLQNI